MKTRVKHPQYRRFVSLQRHWNILQHKQGKRRVIKVWRKVEKDFTYVRVVQGGNKNKVIQQ